LKQIALLFFLNHCSDNIYEDHKDLYLLKTFLSGLEKIYKFKLNGADIRFVLALLFLSLEIQHLKGPQNTPTMFFGANFIIIIFIKY